LSKERRRRKFKPTFENGGFWEYYGDLEHQFEDFLEYVPYIDKNEKVCSFRLTNILMNIGSHIDSAFKVMAQYRKFRKYPKCNEIKSIVKEAREKMKNNEFAKGPGIKLCLRAFEEIYKLSTNTVIFKRLPKREKILPFEVFNSQTKAPYWWDIYNHTKHDFHEKFEQATLRVTRDALAGAFLLNVIHDPAILRLNGFGILKWPPQPLESIDTEFYEHSLIRMPQFALEEMLEQNQSLWCFVETPLFIYDFNPEEENENE